MTTRIYPTRQPLRARLWVLGLFGRIAAEGMSVLNVVAVLSLAEIADAALQGHVFWGSLLAALLLWGPGRLSVDAVAVPRLRAWALGGRRPASAGYTAVHTSLRR